MRREGTALRGCLAPPSRGAGCSPSQGRGGQQEALRGAVVSVRAQAGAQGDG